MTDCRLTKAVLEMLINGGRLRHGVSIVMPDRKVYDVHTDGSKALLFELSEEGAEKVYYPQKDIS